MIHEPHEIPKTQPILTYKIAVSYGSTKYFNCPEHVFYLIYRPELHFLYQCHKVIQKEMQVNMIVLEDLNSSHCSVEKYQRSQTDPTSMIHTLLDIFLIILKLIFVFFISFIVF